MLVQIVQEILDLGQISTSKGPLGTGKMTLPQVRFDGNRPKNKAALKSPHLCVGFTNQLVKAALCLMRVRAGSGSGSHASAFSR